MKLEFKNLRDEKPADGSIICHFKIQTFYNLWEFETSEVEYVWYDEDGGWLSYNNEDFIDGFTLYLNFGGCSYPTNTKESVLWMYLDDIDKALISEGVFE